MNETVFQQTQRGESVNNMLISLAAVATWAVT